MEDYRILFCMLVKYLYGSRREVNKLVTDEIRSKICKFTVGSMEKYIFRMVYSVVFWVGEGGGGVKSGIQGMGYMVVGYKC